MKYVFILVLLVFGGVVSLMGAAVAFRWTHNMTQTARVMPGERRSRCRGAWCRAAHR